jgi:hypothetical protein
MKIYTQLNEGETGVLSVGAAERRWTANVLDIPSEGVVVSALVSDDQVDHIRTRYAREDGGWSKEVCLFPGATLEEVRPE